MRTSKTVTGLLLVAALVGVGAVLYFGFFKAQPQQNSADTNKVPASKFPAKDHILGINSGQADLQTFLKSEYDVQNAECKKTNPNTELAMGVTASVRETFALVSLGCGEGGTSAYYAKVNGAWQLAFKAEDTPKCEDVNRVKFTKEIVAECVTGDITSENTNP